MNLHFCRLRNRLGHFLPPPESYRLIIRNFSLVGIVCRDLLLTVFHLLIYDSMDCLIIF